MNSHELRVHNARIKKDSIVKHLKENGPMRQREIVEMFSCGRALAREAMEEAGYKGMKARDWIGAKTSTYQVRQEQYDKYRNQQQAEAKRKLEKMVKFLRENGPLQSEKIKKKFACGTELAKEAMDLAGWGHIDAAYWRDQIKKGKAKPAQTSSTNKNYNVTRMARPGGLNYLTVAWR